MSFWWGVIAGIFVAATAIIAVVMGDDVEDEDDI